jgi:L-fuconolactonase
MPDRIDSHNHFWRYRADEYAWIRDDMEVIRRDFLPSDLLVNLRAAGIDGTIAVQVRQTMQETEWLLQLSDTTILSAALSAGFLWLNPR